MNRPMLQWAKEITRRRQQKQEPDPNKITVTREEYEAKIESLKLRVTKMRVAWTTIKVMIFVMCFAGFGQFILEETQQNIDFGVYILISNHMWTEALWGINAAKDHADWNSKLNKTIGFFNPIGSVWFDRYWDAEKKKLLAQKATIYEKLRIGGEELIQLVRADRVTVTKKGKKFHLGYCQVGKYIKSSVITRSDAEDWGYLPCQICWLGFWENR